MSRITRFVPYWLAYFTPDHVLKGHRAASPRPFEGCGLLLRAPPPASPLPAAGRAVASTSPAVPGAQFPGYSSLYETPSPSLLSSLFQATENFHRKGLAAWTELGGGQECLELLLSSRIVREPRPETCCTPCKRTRPPVIRLMDH